MARVRRRGSRMSRVHVAARRSSWRCVVTPGTGSTTRSRSLQGSTRSGVVCFTSEFFCLFTVSILRPNTKSRHSSPLQYTRGWLLQVHWILCHLIAWRHTFRSVSVSHVSYIITRAARSFYYTTHLVMARYPDVLDRTCIHAIRATNHLLVRNLIKKLYLTTFKK